MRRTVVRSRIPPGSITDAGAGAELLGFATSDHQHSYDSGAIIDTTTGLFGGNNGWVDSQGEGLYIFKVGTLVAVNGILNNVADGLSKTASLFTVPVDFRLSDSELPRLFRTLLKRNGTKTVEMLRYDTDHIIKLVKQAAGDLDDVIRNIQLQRIRYIKK